MINTYLLPVNQGADCWIDKCFASNPKDAEAKFIDEYVEALDLLDNIVNWEDLIKALDEKGIVIGDIYDIDEF